MFALAKRRQNKVRIIEAEVGRPTHRARPGAHPAPERQLGMALEAPLHDLTSNAPGRTVVLIVLEEAIEHIHVAEIAEGLGRGTKFYVIVRRSGCRRE